MNNKGFAITSVIYGLAILGMLIIVIITGTISASRKNVVEQAEHVEEHLISLNKAAGEFTRNGVFTVPDGESGWYRVEAFGKMDSTMHGAYTTGIIYMKEKDEYRIYINTNGTSMQKDGDTIMMAGAGGTTPGGGLRCYNLEPSGAVIDDGGQTNRSATLIGIDSVSISAASCHTSFIMGYPEESHTGTISRDKYFVDGLILPAASGAPGGKVIIRKVAGVEEINNQIPVKNNNFNNDISQINVNSSSLSVRRICYSYHSTSGSTDGQVHCCNSSTCSGPGSGNRIDDITVFFSNTDAEKLTTSNTSVTLNGSNIIYNADSYYGTTLGLSGLHLSAYQPDPMLDDFADFGNYYMIPVTIGNKVVQAPTNATDPVSMEYINGDISQKWAMDYLNDNFPYVSSGGVGYQREYRIMELSKYKAMSISHDENYENNTISATETFNSLSRNNPQIWNIRSTRDGAYAIKTIVESRYGYLRDIGQPNRRSGFLFGNPATSQILVGRARNPDESSDDVIFPSSTERFYLYSLDFSH